MLPFADRLWRAPYRTDADGRPSEGLGLYEIDRDMKFVKRAESIPGVFGNRKMLDSAGLSIGPHVIDEKGNVRTFPGLRGEHVVASIRHTERFQVYFLTADGRLLEPDWKTDRINLAADVPAELGLKDAKLRFTAGHQAGETIFVTATAPDGRSGCLARWDGGRWTAVDRAAYGFVGDWASMSSTVVAAGWDRASAILKIRSGPGRWVTYRLPKASGDGDDTAGSAWPRIREVETERILMNLGGIFYETTGLGHAWFVRPICTHGRGISDYCSWRGLLVMVGSDAAAGPDPNYVRSAEGAGLWFGATDDLWQFGRAAGEGGPWLKTAVRAGEASEPYLMTNFENKRVELSHDAGGPVEFTILVDALGTRKAWKTYRTLTVPAGRKVVHEFPDGFSAHWVRLKTDRDCRATGWFVYD